MPALENLLAAAPAPRNARADAPEKFSNPASSGEAFDQAMSHALAPAPAKTTVGKNPFRPGKNPSVASAGALEKTQIKTPTGTDLAVALPGKISNGKTDDSAGTGKISAAADNPIPSDSNPPPVPTANDPLRHFWLPPFFPNAGGDLPPPLKNLPASQTATAEKLSPVAVLPLGAKVPAAILPMAAMDSNPGGGLTEARPGGELPLKNFSPVSAAEAAVLEKNIFSAATKPEVPENSTPLPPEQNSPLAAELAVTPAAEKTAEAKVNAAPLPAAATVAGKNDLNPPAAMDGAAGNAGTGVATTVLPMKNPQKTNKVAGLEVKVLPVGENNAAREKKFPSVLLVTPVRTADTRSPDLNFSFTSSSSDAPVAENTPVLNVIDLPALADARLRAVERTHDMMALHAMRLVESKFDSMSVVIKPAVGTELSLELRQRNGGVEAQATLTRGDHQLLSQHWPELQSRLEQRGIKLAPLGSETGFSAGDNGNFQQHQTSPEDALQQATAFAEFAATGGATARLVPVHDGWESWA